MKTKMKGFRSLKSLIILTMIAFLAASCGQENQSGQSNDGNFVNGVFTNYGTVNGANINQVLNVVARENVCVGNGAGFQFGNQPINATSQRVRVQTQLLANANIGSIYIGVSSYGDIVVARNNNGQIQADVYLCARAGMSNQVTQMRSPFDGQIIPMTLNQSQLCPVSEITTGYLDIAMQGNAGAYRFGLSPIHIPGTNRVSSLCSLNRQF